jgi:hypothetical protein
MAQTKEILKQKRTDITKTIIHNGMEITKREAEAQQHDNKRQKFFSAQRDKNNQTEILNTKIQH